MRLKIHPIRSHRALRARCITPSMLQTLNPCTLIRTGPYSELSATVSDSGEPVGTITANPNPNPLPKDQICIHAPEPTLTREFPLPDFLSGAHLPVFSSISP